VDAGDGHFEQLLQRVAQHRATGCVRGEEAVVERVEDERRIARLFEEAIDNEPRSAQACLIPST
jgi:hypothetical protein